MRKPRFYRYILRHDDGWAPCSDDGLLTLATCKPAIRRTAAVGDYVAGYQPKAKGEGLLCWFGRIEGIMPHEAYSALYRGRRDANYEIGDSGQWQRRDHSYHSAEPQLVTDVSAPALLFDMNETWYFGCEPQQPPLPLEPLRAVGQGHRVIGRLPGDVENLIEWLLKGWRPGILHPPRDAGSGCIQTCGAKAPEWKSGAC